MTVSRLEMGWDTGVLVINWRGSRVLVDVENEQQRARRRKQGPL